MKKNGKGTRRRDKGLFALRDKGQLLDRKETDRAHIAHRQMAVYKGKEEIPILK